MDELCRHCQCALRSQLMAMNTRTVTDRPPKNYQTREAVLKLLFYGEQGVCSWQRCLLSPNFPIGRRVDSATGLCLVDDPTASAQHAAIRKSASDFVLMDLGSKNGTFVNGARVHEATLREGDVIRIGGSLLVLRYESLETPDAPEGPIHSTLRGSSQVTKMLRYRISRAAPERSAVLLQGPTGTGKELAAEAIHRLSGRSGRLVRLNAAAITASLAESTLFGHAAHAFTGAAQHDGCLREADGGTLVLDEVGDLPLELQPKLLRALEEGCVTPVGGRRAVPIDVRFVSSTNRDLRQAVTEGRFRADLHERLGALVIDLPPLRSRKEDILPLLLHFLGRPEQLLTARLCELLLLYGWPGNVRELANLAARARTLGARERALDLPALLDELRLDVDPTPADEHLPQPLHAADATPNPRPSSAYSAEMLERMFRESDGKLSRVAERVGVDRQTIRRWARRLGLDLNELQERRPSSCQGPR